jgi:zinc protease
VQRKVVCEEFKEHYINQPYGDIWHKMRELAYKVHPYQWMTIGKDLSHVENAELQDVKNFFFKHYRPVNAILSVAGNVKTEDIKRLAEKWFGDILMGEKYIRQVPQEPAQTTARKLEVTADVPLNALYKTWHMPARLDKGYYAAELITEILGGGASSRLYQSLIKEKKLFSNINCYQFGSIDPGLFAIEGKLIKGIKLEDAEAAVEEELDKIKRELVSVNELEKVKNKTESMITFEDMTISSRAASLANYELLGNANLMNEEMGKYQEVTADDILIYGNQIFDKNNSNTLYYLSKN